MGSQAAAEYAAFEEKVRRTVYIDNLSPHVSESVLKTALDQFGAVKNVQFIPNYLGPRNMPHCVLVEMEEEKQAKAVISALSEFPFMILGMPRPVRARAAQVHMFEDRPIKPGRKIQSRWLDRDDPDFEVSKRLKQVVQRHAAEVSFLVKLQLEKEEKLAKQQAEALKANYKKYEMIEGVMSDDTARSLARRYKLRVLDD